ncbi:MAG: hypothetical protein ACO1TE_02575 [Prosthecobacter sp.]
MKLHSLLFVLVVALHADAADFAAWTHRQTVHVSSPGLTRLELEPALLDASRSSGGAPFHDLRLISPAGVETPYVIALPRLIRPVRVDAINFRSTLNPSTTVLEFQPPAREVINEVVLDTPAPNFIKAATLQASSDGVTWQTLSSGEVLCRQNNTERLRIPVTPDVWTHFRVTIDDTRDAPVIFAGARVQRELPELRTLSHPVTIRDRLQTKGETRLTLDLGTANILLGSVRLHTPELVFQRDATLLGTRRTLFRLKHDGFTGEELEIPVQQTATTRQVELIIRNGDSPPLRIDSVEATRHPVPMVFQADSAGEWQLYIGNAQATEPQYDIAALSDRLRDATANSATASPVEASTAFRKTATAPEVGESGAALDVSAWSFRRPVEFAEAGVIELDLDPAVLARTENDLHDLRIIREGQQIPFLIVRPGTQREVVVPFISVLDEKSPTWSKWALTLPLAGFPASELVIESSTPLFERQLSILEHRDTEQGRTERGLGSALWRRRPGQATQALHVALHSPPKSDTLQLQTDNGDNAPLQITAVHALYPVARLLFRVPDTTPVHLVYGHRRATYPRYDLHLVRREFESATKISATLGKEEKLPGYHADPAHAAQRGKGSVWLWIVLAAVVGVLLWVVAKMLPKADAGDASSAGS